VTWACETLRTGHEQRNAPLCDSCAEARVCRMGIGDLSILPDRRAYGELVVPAEVQGHVVAHGGWTAWVFDEFLGYLSNALGPWSVTRELSVSYVRPVPVGSRVAVTAWLSGSSGSRREMRGEMRLLQKDTLLASAVGQWVVLPDAERHYTRAQRVDTWHR
jgi:acyl-coenzyme A thioesterase PaaI-like protein